MKRHIILMIVALAAINYSSPSILLAQDREMKNGGKNWTVANTVFITTSTVLLFVDWRQTMYGYERHDVFYEKNPILGKAPSRRTPNLYFLGAILANVSVGRLLKNPWRDVFLLGVTAWEARTVAKNTILGVGLSFKF